MQVEKFRRFLKFIELRSLDVYVVDYVLKSKI